MEGRANAAIEQWAVSMQAGVRRVRGGISPEGGVAVGATVVWLSIIVLLPLATLVAMSLHRGWFGWWRAVTGPAALAALRVTVEVSALVAVVDAVMGTLIAWVLVRDRFPGKRVVDAVIDLPFALPTIVAGIVLLALYGPDSPVDIRLEATRPGLLVALAFVTLPFVVRSVQPVLLALDPETEQAAASLGAGNAMIFRTVILPSLWPAILGGAGLSFARAIGEYGSVVLIGGNIPRHTQVASQYIQQEVESDMPTNAAAVSVVLLLMSFLVLSALRLLSVRGAGAHRR